MNCFRPILHIFFVLSLLAPVQVAGEEKKQPKAPISIPATTAQFKIDGLVDEAGWNSAWTYELKYEVNPGDSIPAPVRTELFMTYDNKYVYFGFKCYDPDPSSIRAHLSDRDTFYGDDWVGVVLDTMNDERRDYLLLVNPFGVQLDNIESPTGGAQWDAIWASAGKRTKWGWSAEMKVPFASLRFQRTKNDQVWGFDGVRGYPRSQFKQMGAFPRDRNNNCYQCQLIKIKGFAGVKRGQNIELIPALTYVSTDERSSLPDGDFENIQKKGEGGLTARWGITPNMVLSGTLNPDFSQVEADAVQLGINQPFALYYEEKRPFFMEGADLFDSNINVIYSRSLRDPKWGAKLSGKIAGHSLGAYVVQDSMTNLIFPGAQSSSSTSLPMNALAGVFRYSKDIGNKYTVGALFTDREGDDYYNRVYGFDGVLRFTNKDRVAFQVLGSSTKYPEQVSLDYGQKQGNFSDTAMTVSYTHQDANIRIMGNYDQIGENFRADLGFLPQVGFRLYRGQADYRWRKSNHWWDLILVLAGTVRSEDFEGNLLRHNTQVGGIISGIHQSQLELWYSYAKQNYNNVSFDLNVFQGSFEIQPIGNMATGVNFRLGDQIDFANTRPAKQFFIRPYFNLNLGSHLRVNLNHVYENMAVLDKNLYRANITQGTVVYQFNTRVFLRGIVQYTDYRYNVENYTFDINPEFQKLLCQFLFSYKLNPRTVLFLGYSDNYFGGREYGLTQSDRTLFLKISYNWAL